MTRQTRRAAVAVAGAAVLSLALSACGSSGDSSPSASSSKSPAASALPSVDPATVPTAPPNPATDANLKKLPNVLSSDGTTIVVGDPKAKNRLQVYEDPRCPFCKQFELANGAQLAKSAAEGKIRIEYTLASFLDKNLGGGGSKRAVNALRAALSEKKFPQYHAAIYENQPADEQEDKFTNAFLVQLGTTIPGLSGAAFDKAVTTDRYASFVAASEKAFETSGANSTPTVKLNGKQIDPNKTNFMNPVIFAQLLEQVGAR